MARVPAYQSFLAAILIAGVLVFALVRGWLDPIQGILLRTLGPTARVSVNLVEDGAGIVGSFLRVATLSRTVRELEQENLLLRSELTQVTEVTQENEDLRRELELLPREEYSLVTAEVIGRTSDGINDILIINRGTNDGIHPRMAVIVHDGVVVGKVGETTPSTAMIVLVTDTSSRIASAIQESETQGLVRGVRGLDIIMESVPRTAEVSEGDTVVTSGADGIFPPGLLIGEVRSIDSSESDIFQSIRVTPSADVQRIRFVSIIQE